MPPESKLADADADLASITLAALQLLPEPRFSTVAFRFDGKGRQAKARLLS